MSVTRWKRPGSRVDFVFYLPAVGDDDAIASADVAVVTDGTVTADHGTIVEDGAAVRVWVEGGDEGDRAKVRVTVTTIAGRIDTQELRLEVGYQT